MRQRDEDAIAVPWRLPDDHHAITRLARDDRKRARDESRVGASRTRADLRMKTSESALARAIDHIANVDSMSATGCRSAWSDHLTGGQKAVGSSPTTPTRQPRSAVGVDARWIA